MILDLAMMSIKVIIFGIDKLTEIAHITLNLRGKDVTGLSAELGWAIEEWL